MVRCPNCGQKTRGDYCQWCNYPILKGKLKKRHRVEKKKKVAEAQISPAKDSVLDSGQIKLVVQKPLILDQARQFEESLKQVEDLSLVWSGGSEEEGMIITAQTHRPMSLVHMVKEMPQVEKVERKKGKIIISLKAPGAG